MSPSCRMAPRLATVGLLAAACAGCSGRSTLLFENGSDSSTAAGWSNITPAESTPELWGAPGGPCEGGEGVCTYGPHDVVLAPSDPRIVYLALDQLGAWRSGDSGSSWSRLGDPAGDTDPEDGAVAYLDSPVRIEVDPDDAAHLYAIQPDGRTPGFWISRDAGASWVMPAGFRTLAQSGLGDAVHSMAVDPTSFDHVLVGYTGEWPTTSNASSGIARSTDGGASFMPISPAGDPWSTGAHDVHFLYEPSLGIGNSRTWLVCEPTGFWWTDDAGASWLHASTDAPFIRNQLEYDRDGVLFAAAEGAPVYSEDNGRSWIAIEALAGSYYTAMGGDGERVYTRGYSETPMPYLGASGGEWSPLLGSELASGFPIAIRFDAVDRILYSANRSSGLWAWRAP
jgi:hypothetical protein